LSPAIERTLTDLVAQARASLGDDLRSIVLFGSGAEGRLRATSDLNVLFILRRFAPASIDPLREPLRLAHVAHRVAVMFLLEDELLEATEAFAVKFADIRRRHRVLWGEPLLADLVVAPAAQRRQLRQMLLNLQLRLRERYAALSLREEQLALVLAEAAGPLRVAASALLELENQPAASPREALARLAVELCAGDAESLLALISDAREHRSLPPGEAAPALLRLLALVAALRTRLGTEA
jgi:predicted nucleotidyltransferase